MAAPVAVAAAGASASAPALLAGSPAASAEPAAAPTATPPPPPAPVPPPAQKPVSEPPPPPLHAEAPPRAKALTPAAVQAGVGRLRGPLDGCVQVALRSKDGQALLGRHVGLLLLISPSGLVEGSEVEEADIERSPLGDCLRKVASRMTFTPFEGEEVALRVPLVLAASSGSAAAP